MPLFPPLAPTALLALLVALLVLLLVARLLGRLAGRLGLPAVVGELLAGVLLGPSLLGHLLPGLAGRLLPSTAAEMHLVDAVAQLGGLLLVAVAGAQVDRAMLTRLGRAVATVSLAGLLVPLAGGVGLGLLLPLPAGAQRWPFAAFLGVAMAVTALPVIAKTLADMGLLHHRIGQLTLAAGAVDDAIAWFLLAVVAAATTGTASPGPVLGSAAVLIGFVVLAATAGRAVARRVLRRAGEAPGDTATVAVAVLLVLTGAAGTHALGLEPVFGAFVAGLLLGGPGGADPRRLAPLRTVVLAVLAPIFLASAGLRMDLTALARPAVAGTAAAVLAVAIGGKFAGAYLGARLGRLGHWEGLALGAGMNARGVVEVVVAMAGLRLGVLDVPAYTTVVLVAVVTSVMAPPLLRLAMARIGPG